MRRIKVLPEALINKIAAGEVVERPASVVKELAENSIDAGATTVRVKLGQGGLSAICVTDDGLGMSRDDALTALQRHATSKLDSVEGLFHILTKGFRGEALPAIASVSRFSLVTRAPDAKVGTRVSVEGGSAPVLEEAPAAGGTRIDVDDLFFNTPARRKFMKRDATELVHSQEALLRLALAHPEVGFFLEHEGRALFSSPACPQDPTERIAAALGPEVHPHLLKVDERRLGVHVTGWVASPEFTLPNARGLYTFVNHRYVRDRGLNFAVQRAYQEQLPPGRQPVAVLFIELDPAAVDVNVHPQKLEVRFVDGRGVQEAVLAGVSRALKSAPWLNRDQPQPSALDGAYYAQAVDRFLARAQTNTTFFEPQAGSTGAGAGSLGFGQARPGINQAPPPGYFSALRFIGELGARFWVCEAPGGTLVVIDPRAARERVTLHQLGERLRQGTLDSNQGGLFSATVELGAEALQQLVAATGALARLGLDVEPFGVGAVAVKALPIEASPADLPALLAELLSALSEGDQQALQVLAAHAAPPVARQVTHAEASALLAQLDEADFERPCRHGTVVVHELTLLELLQRAEN